jgi:hypothetical protein
MATRIEVDFNTRDDADDLLAPLGDAEGPVQPGALVDCFDDEGNRCLGLIAGFSTHSVAVTPLWATFVRPGEGRALVETIQSPPDLQRLICWTILTTAERSPRLVAEQHHRSSAWPSDRVYPVGNTLTTLGLRKT